MKKESKQHVIRQKEIIMEFLRVIAARPSKRYPVFVWKIPSIFPGDILEIFNRWLGQSRFKDDNPFKKQRHFFRALYAGFDSYGINWHTKTSYQREKIYFSNLRLKENGCRLLMDIGARTYIGD